MPPPLVPQGRSFSFDIIKPLCIRIQFLGFPLDVSKRRLRFGFAIINQGSLRTCFHTSRPPPALVADKHEILEYLDRTDGAGLLTRPTEGTYSRRMNDLPIIPEGQCSLRALEAEPLLTLLAQHRRIETHLVKLNNLDARQVVIARPVRKKAQAVSHRRHPVHLLRST